MKKTLRALAALAAAFALTLTACQAQPAAAVDTVQPAPSSQAAESAPGPAQEEGSHILIAYFSVPETDGVDTVSGASRVVVEGDVLGNNQYIAQLMICFASRRCRPIPAPTASCLPLATTSRHPAAACRRTRKPGQLRCGLSGLSHLERRPAHAALHLPGEL